MNLLSKSQYVKLVFIIILSLGFYYYGSFSHTNTEKSFKDKEIEKHNHIESLFGKMTAEEAYKAFKEENIKRDIKEQHNYAHIFGEILYKHEGPNGFTICDGDFGFGCFHTFVSLAIAGNGENIIKKLDKLCVEKYTDEGLGCSHGIGHGVLAYYGYTSEDLKKALSVCKTLTWQHPYGGCQDGVFMEYNLRTMASGLEGGIRIFSFDRRYEPCDVISQQFHYSCYFSQPSWWLNSSHEEPNIVSRMSGFCDELKLVEEKKSCFRGLSYAKAPDFIFDAKKGISLCDSISTNSLNKLWCREGYAWALYANNSKKEALSICTDGLSVQESNTCKNEYLFVIQ